MYESMVVNLIQIGAPKAWIEFQYMYSVSDSVIWPTCQIFIGIILLVLWSTNLPEGSNQSTNSLTFLLVVGKHRRSGRTLIWYGTQHLHRPVMYLAKPLNPTPKPYL